MIIDIKKQDQAIQKDEETRPGIYAGAGIITPSDFDETDYDDLMQDYTDMRNGDNIVATTLNIIKTPLLLSEMKINDTGTEVSKEAVGLLYWCFEQLRDGEQDLRYHANLKIDYGHIFFEKVIQRGVEYRTKAGKKKTTNIITRMSPVQYHTIQRFEYDDKMDFSGMRHIKYDKDGKTAYIDIGKEKLFWFVYCQEFRDVRGRSILRPVRKLWKYKHAILDATTMACQRGAGIPNIKMYNAGDNSDLNTRADLIGRSLGNFKNAYVKTEPGKLEVELMGLQNQENNLPLLQWIDTGMFLNTMTQFMISGIGANGSRAATSEHRSSFELMANNVLIQDERRYNDLAGEMMTLSYLGQLSKEDMPVITFASVSQIDLTKAEGQIRGLVQSGAVKLREGDEDYIRSIFGLPEIKIIEPILQDKQTDIEKKDKAEAVGLSKKMELSNKILEMNEYERDIFELESANEHYLIIQEEAENIINFYTEKIFKDIAIQLKKNKNDNIRINYENELIEKLQELYVKGLDRGKRDAKKELSKIKSTIELASAPLPTLVGVKKSIERSVKKLRNDIKNVIETALDKSNDKYIESKGGLEEYIMSFSTGLKGEKSSIIGEVQTGYTDGRGSVFKALPQDQLTYMCTANMDGNLCVECAEWHGMLLTGKEIEQSNIIQLVTPINQRCIGLSKNHGGTSASNHDCRCQLIVVSIGSNNELEYKLGGPGSGRKKGSGGGNQSEKKKI